MSQYISVGQTIYVAGSQTGTSDLVSGFYITLNSQSIEGNYSNITVRPYLTRHTNYPWNHTAATGYVTVDGGTNYTSITYDTRDMSNGENRYLGEYVGSENFWNSSAYSYINTNISHNPDGSRNVGVTCYMPLANGTTTGNFTSSDTFILPTIARTSVIGSVSAFNVEKSFSVPVTKYSYSFSDTLTIKIGSTTIKTVSGYISGDSISFTSAEILAIYQIQSSTKSSTFTFTITTYSGSTYLGSSSTTATGTSVGLIEYYGGSSWSNSSLLYYNGSSWNKGILWYYNGSSWVKGNAS